MKFNTMKFNKMKLNKITIGTICALAFCVCIFFIEFNLQARNSEQPTDRYDVIIYGGSSAGIAAAIQVRRMGKTVLVIEPTQRIGGLTTGGLGQTDIGNKAAIGGIAREFYQRVREHYQQDSAWKWEKPDQYKSGGQSRTLAAEDTMWTFEPSAALTIYQSMIKENRIKVIYGERLDRSTPSAGVHKKDGRISAIRMESGKEFGGRVFIDATYEGDLLAAANVTYTVGRESNDLYDETLNGVQTARAIHHQFKPGVDPYRIKGDKSSGLLPGVDPKGPGPEGKEDRRVQAYCFRMCLTDHPENRIPFQKPDGYNESEYELLFRNFEAGAKVIPWSHSLMPNRKSDTNNNRGFSTDFVGRNYDYPEASYAERDKIVRQHLVYQQGLMWTLAYHPRTPEFVRKVISRWGTCQDEFESKDGWQKQLYIREARRMVGNMVMTQHHCQGRKVASKPVGLAAYTMDSHNVQRHVDKLGFARNEGDVQVGGFSPYPIDYGCLTPKESECSNLLVPVCLSASHMAFGSIRMEPVFMVLGQSAATAAVHAIEEKCSVQKIDYSKLKLRLEQDKQRLVWTGPKKVVPVGMNSKRLRGLVMDNAVAKSSGFETNSTSAGPYFDRGYVHDGNAGKGRQKIEYRFKIPVPGKYEVRMAYTTHPNRATNVPVTIDHVGGKSVVKINQRKEPNRKPFQYVGIYGFDTQATVTIGNAETDGFVIADVIQLVKVKD